MFELRTDFIAARALSWRYFRKLVEPTLTRDFPRLQYAAALSG